MRATAAVCGLRRGKGLKIFQIARRSRSPRFIKLPARIAAAVPSQRDPLALAPSLHRSLAAASRRRDLLPGARNEAVAEGTLGTDLMEVQLFQAISRAR